ncbi:flagellar basal body rod protein FlgB [Legionella birminghamensis]|uniref:Flagellar basal body rod protein FlgB n=1 Tax=Legionella birminghamensis TaxID=28083 RepID=A0A378I867_9GAMM|nr:flagellar basal body protein [Legionella birminghamensis]KTC68301.1 flagellar basal body rod protein FlgB [Legionella birminghamensis]STX30986.1 flagellar basal body rod protein FlgB [Legionella birminghamensis]
MFQDSTITLIKLGLDAAVMRQTSIAANIANINTPGYQATEVLFEQQLADLDFNLNRLSDLKPQIHESDSRPALDEQIALGINNATQFRALIKGLNHKLAIMKMALHGSNQA